GDSWAPVRPWTYDTGEACVNRLIPDANLTLKKLPNNYAEITSGAAHYKIVGMAPEEFPKLPKEDATHLVSLKGSTILDITRTPPVVFRAGVIDYP
ncbi:MAG TPA: hypothetical protein PK022_07265, partial [Syntrophales bacterium]|nr:hypothetical protein [Syntrophales bacterium]